MAWTDKASDAQIGSWCHMVRWCLPSNIIDNAANFAREHFTKKDMSAELGRVRELTINRSLGEHNCLDSEIWKEFKND